MLAHQAKPFKLHRLDMAEFDSSTSDTDDIDAEHLFATRMGVHYPTGFAMIATVDPARAQHFERELQTAGIGAHQTKIVAADEIRDFLIQSKQDASMLARAVGAELKQSELFLQLAQQGSGFLFVRVPHDEARDLLLDVGKRVGAQKAALYHTLAVEELPFSVEEMPGASPYGVNESSKAAGAWNADRAPDNKE